MGIMIYAIPVFFILMGVELTIAFWQERQVYNFSDAISNISCGIVQQLSGVFIGIIGVFLYQYCFEVWRISSPIAINWWTSLILFFLIDFLYYWFHRLSHEINTLWGAHVVHHQSEEYNLSVALRQSSFQGIFSSVFYLPLAILGFEPAIFLTLKVFQTLYQFWIHTELILRLPYWFEYIFNTPSHHRVHHGRNPEYIDRNHGGTLILFDRWFGTFEAEEAPVVYGVTKALGSYDPIWANFDYYKDLFIQMRKKQSFLNRLRTLYKSPGWQPQELGGALSVPEISREEQHKYRIDISASALYYASTQFLIILLTTVAILLFKKNWDSTMILLAISWILYSCFCLGNLLDKSSYGLPLEKLRLLVAPLLVYMVSASFSISIILILQLLVSLASLLFLWRKGHILKLNVKI